MVVVPELVLFVGVARVERAGEEENVADVEFEDCPTAKGGSSSSDDLICNGEAWPRTRKRSSNLNHLYTYGPVPHARHHRRLIVER